MIVPSLQFLAAEITSQLYKQNGKIFQVIPQPCISFVEKVCSVLQTTKSAFRYTCTLGSPVPPPKCNITYDYDELKICAQFSANNLDFYFIKDPNTELCDTISVIDQNVHGKQSLEFILSSALTCDCTIASYNIDSIHILDKTVFNFKDLNLEDTLYYKKILQCFCTSDISYELFPLITQNFHLHSRLPADDFRLCIELL